MGMAECPEPPKCGNCREEGHMTSECPEPEVCRRCKKEGHKVADCPEPMRCNRCGEEGHMVRDCTQEEQTRQYTDAEGNEKEIYVPKADCPEKNSSRPVFLLDLISASTRRFL